MHLSIFPILQWIICYIITGGHCIEASPKRHSCRVQNDRADCRHLSLEHIPPDLPGNITSLDMSHNRLKALPAVSLSPYSGLLHLHVSFNSISKLGEDICQTLALLQTLNVERNEVVSLTEKDFSRCTNLRWLNLAANRLKLKGEPFSALQSLTFLDVSKNKLMSASLSTHPQLPSLATIRLSGNTIGTIKKDDFHYLSHSLSLRVLDLSYLSLTKLETGCFKPIASIHTLIMNGSRLGTQLTAKLCSELSGTAISSLSLRMVRLGTLPNNTFQGLQKTNLTILDISNNNIGKIGDGSFNALSRLEVLILEQNSLKVLTKGAFQGLKSLKRLNLNKALVKSRTSSTPVIEDFSFQPLSALESLTLHQTEIKEITENTFAGLTSLQELELDWCHCSSFKSTTNKTFISLAASPLRKLNLTATAISHLGPGSFSMFRNLTTLLLDFNFIKQMLNGDEFQGLDQIEHIYLSNNKMITLSSKSFVHVPNLRTLTLGKSLTGTLDLNPSPFSPLTKLTYLDLSNNNIANINAGLLSGLVNLSVLKLQHNNLARIWKHFNLGGPVLFLEGLQNLAVLNMEYNGLDEIPIEALRSLSNLRELSLSNNILNILKDTVFDELRSLQDLYLQKNFITAVRQEVFMKPLANLSFLLMDKNPFDCTCESILWFVSWLNKTNANVPGLKEHYICNTPLAYSNHTVMQFDPLSCKDMMPEACFILSSTVVTTFIVIALFVRFHGWRIRFYWNILINRTLGFSDAKAAKGKKYEYDAYVIHAEQDKPWVDKCLLPLENEKYEFYLENRDAVPGMPQLQCIVDNMKKSRKLLFVVTESLLKDRWCGRFKVHHALHQVIEDNRNSVVLVFLQDIQDYRLSRSMYLRRGMLCPRCILYWPVHKEKVPAFRQKLRIALGMTNRLQ